MDAEVAGADRSSSGPQAASVSRWLAAGARWLVRVGTMPGGDAIAWPAGLCYAGWLAGVLVSGQPHSLRTLADGTLVALPAVVVASHVVTALRRHGPWQRRLPADHARIENVRDPRISELLGRRPVRTGVEAVAGRFAGRRILVTGAGGSIGAELCRQLHQFAPAELIMLDRDESALHEVQLALHGRALLDSDETVLADIRDARRVREVFERFRPQIVFHAAALKHLPLLERYPVEAVKSNIFGTQTVLEAAAAGGAESFVNISTDKAADPVSVLGYSKKIAERLTAHMAGQADGTYLSVRFGNVLGSRGSVLGALSAQVGVGGPLTVTDPEVSRYFMTADEAVQLVLQAVVVGSSGEVLILDMGEPVRIADIARRLAARSRRPVDIVYTGLRPGEKLSEQLLGSDEVDHRPRHPLVRHVLAKPLDPGDLPGLLASGDDATLRQRLAECAMAEAGVARPAWVGQAADEPWSGRAKHASVRWQGSQGFARTDAADSDSSR